MVKLNKILITSLAVTMTTQAFSQQNDLLNALYGSQEEPAVSTDIAGPSGSGGKDIGETESMQTAKVCTEKDQKSLPLRVLLGLLRTKGASLEVSHNADSGELSIYGGPMIGNCQSMIDFQIAEPTAELPYVFQAKIKNCGGDSCSYKVIKDGEEVVSEFAPTQAGFISCLESTGVMAEGKIVREKIAPVELSLTKKGVNQSAELWFGSQGPAAVSMTGVYSKGNKKSGVGCFYFEDIVKDGYQVYSKEDIAVNRKRDEFQVLCKSGNYRLIDDKIGEFEEFKLLQQMLISVRNKLIEDDVKKLAAELKTSKDYSSLDISVIKDFYEKVILPKKEQIKEKYQEYLAATGDIKYQKEKELKALQEELSKYGQPPFLSEESLSSLALSEQKHAPLHLDGWYDNMLVLNRSLATIKAYKSFKGTSANGRSKSPLTAEQEVNQVQATYARNLDESRYKHNIRNNYVEGSPSTDLNNSRNAILQAVNRRNQELQQMIQEEMMHIQNYCLNPQKYWLNRQQCVQESQENIAYWKQCVQELNNRDVSAAQKLGSRASELAKEEAKRGQGDRSTANVAEVKSDDSYVPEQFTFDFKNARGSDNTQMNMQGQQQFNMQRQQYQQQYQNSPMYSQQSWNPNGLSMQQYAQQNPGWRGGFNYGQYGQQSYYPQQQYNNGLNFNLNAGFGQNYGMQNYYGMGNNMMYGQPSYSPMMMNNGMGMNGMNYPYMNNTGVYNFSFQ